MTANGMPVRVPILSIVVFSMTITMNVHGTLIQLVHSVVVSAFQNVAAVSHDQLAAATQAVADGDTDTTNHIEDEVMRANQQQWRAGAGDESHDTVTVPAAWRYNDDNDAGVDVRDTITSDGEDGIHGQVAVVPAAAGLPW